MLVFLMARFHYSIDIFLGAILAVFVFDSVRRRIDDPLTGQFMRTFVTFI